VNSPDPATRFVHAIAQKDRSELEAVLAEELDFRGLTPNQEWRAGTPAELIEILLGSWFEPKDEVIEVLDMDRGQVGDRQTLSYRFRVRNPDGEHVVQQEGFYHEVDGRITWLRVLCSGFRPADSPDGQWRTPH
jgi:ketosteroid isomerase-like protein